MLTRDQIAPIRHPKVFIELIPMTHSSTHRGFAVLTLSMLFASLALLAVADQAGASAKYPCKAKHAKLLKKRGYVRVFQLRRDERDPRGALWSSEDVLACDGRVGRWIRIYPSEFTSAGVIRISGRFVGYEIGSSCGACFGDTSTVGVINAATGQSLFTRSRDADVGQGSFDITDMVLEPNGSVAFIAVGNWRTAGVDTRSVVRHDCNGTTVLQAHRGIRVRSLKLESGMLRWRSGRHLRTAGIC